jgi:hypothetical protein
MSGFNGEFILQDINNGTLKAIKSMPIKDSTSDGTSSFSIDRNVYMQTLPIVTPTVAQNLHKKWFKNRDASEVTRNRRINEVGVGSLNASNKLQSFTTYRVVNTVNDALTRVRAGGACAPPKKNALRTNGPTPAFPRGILQRSNNHSIANIQPKMAMASKPISKNLQQIYH